MCSKIDDDLVARYLYNKATSPEGSRRNCRNHGKIVCLWSERRGRVVIIIIVVDCRLDIGILIACNFVHHALPVPFGRAYKPSIGAYSLVRMPGEVKGDFAEGVNVDAQHMSCFPLVNCEHNFSENNCKLPVESGNCQIRENRQIRGDATSIIILPISWSVDLFGRLNTKVSQDIDAKRRCS